MHPPDQSLDLVHILFYVLSVVGGLGATAVGFIWKNHLRSMHRTMEEMKDKFETMETRNREDHKEFFRRLGELEVDVGVLKNRKLKS